jgi:hypothetical protein
VNQEYELLEIAPSLKELLTMADLTVQCISLEWSLDMDLQQNCLTPSILFNKNGPEDF